MACRSDRHVSTAPAAPVPAPTTTVPGSATTGPAPATTGPAPATTGSAPATTGSATATAVPAPATVDPPSARADNPAAGAVAAAATAVPAVTDALCCPPRLRVYCWPPNALSPVGALASSLCFLFFFTPPFWRNNTDGGVTRGGARGRPVAGHKNGYQGGGVSRNETGQGTHAKKKSKAGKCSRSICPFST